MPDREYALQILPAIAARSPGSPTEDRSKEAEQSAPQLGREVR